MVAPISHKTVDRWLERGIITADQREAILQDLANDRPHGGGLLVLIAYSIFLGAQWGSLAPGARIAISSVSLLVFAGIAQAQLRDPRYQIPGELLQVVAVVIVPLLVFALLDAAGVWPHDPNRYCYNCVYRPATEAMRRRYQLDLTWARMGLAGATMAGALVAFRLSRSPFVLVAAIVAVISLFLDASIQIEGSRVNYAWHTPQSLVVAAIGAIVLTAGIYVRGRTCRDYTPWLFVTGLTAMAVGLSFKTFPHNAPVWGALWMIVAVIVLALSIPLQERLLAAAGLAAVFAYCAKLVFDVFDSASAALVMAMLGLLVLGAGMLYQRLVTARVATPQAQG